MRRAKTLLWFVQVFLIAKLMVGQDRHPRIIENRREDGLATQTVLLSPKEFLEPVLLGLAREQIAQDQKVDMLQVRFVVESSIAREVSGKGLVHTSYDMWRREYSLRKQREYAKVAELVKIGPNATLRISFPDSVKEIRLEGDNVFHRDAQGVVLDLLHTAVIRQGFGENKHLTAILYYRINKWISSKEAMTIARSVGLPSHLQRVKVLMRTDEWYTSDPYYPWFNPFTRVLDTPTEEELGRSKGSVCESQAENVCYESSSGSK